MSLKNIGYGLLGIGILGYLVWDSSIGERPQSFDPVTPNWAAIADWPGSDTAEVAAQPDPNRRITAIVLDDSGSMGSDINAAKQAVIQTLNAMADADRVAVVALNAGIVLPFSDVRDARGLLPGALRPLRSDGTTPLTKSVVLAERLLAAEAGAARSFGTYRMIVTTDGEADDAGALIQQVARMTATTPIQLTTIGINVSAGHVLRRTDVASFVDVADVAGLGAALEAAVAENTDFTAITDFAN